MWLPIDDVYCVSIDGQVKKNGKIMKGAFDSLGYRQVSQYGRLTLIHRLVAARFLPSPPGEGTHQLDHIDRDKSNNHASNLRWCDKSTNMLNRGFKLPSTGEKYITLYTLGNGSIRYVFTMQRNSKKYKQYFNTLEEAINFRNHFLATM